ncbi:hypothetical protein PLICRDRAFT_92992 [Plicaturopsis crispa FD-325 SS-3]|nr:hypothetical protein PLICRDRAFT_92992 [Plicaturopsis crispa FD-325 SS-3]
MPRYYMAKRPRKPSIKRPAKAALELEDRTIESKFLETVTTRPIPKPPSMKSLQSIKTRMGYGPTQSARYLRLRAHAKEIALVHLDVCVGIGRQDPVALAKAFDAIQAKHPFLNVFEDNWAAHFVLQDYLANHKKWKARYAAENNRPQEDTCNVPGPEADEGSIASGSSSLGDEKASAKADEADGQHGYEGAGEGGKGEEAADGFEDAKMVPAPMHYSADAGILLDGRSSSTGSHPDEASPVYLEEDEENAEPDIDFSAYPATTSNNVSDAPYKFLVIRVPYRAGEKLHLSFKFDDVERYSTDVLT